MEIRQRVLKYLDYKNIKRSQFYKLTKLSNGYLDKEGSMSTASCEKIFSIFPDMNPEWLLTGKGSMLRAEEPHKDNDKRTVEALVDKLVELSSENTLLKKENEDLRTAFEGYKDRFSTADSEDVLAAEAPDTTP